MKMAKDCWSDTTSSSSGGVSTVSLKRVMERLHNQKHRDSTKKNYYTIWKIFNRFVLSLDKKPRAWEDRITLFVGHLVNSKKQSVTVKNYLSAIRTVKKMKG